MNKMDIIQKVLGLCSSIYQMIGSMKSNKERCKHTEDRVKLLEQLVSAIKEPGQISPVVERALQELCSTLTSAKDLIAKYSKVTGFKSFVKSRTFEDKFIKMNEKLKDTFQILSAALQIEQRDILLRRQPTSPLQCPTPVPRLPAPLPPATPMLPPTPIFPPIPMSSSTAAFPFGFITPACAPASQCLQGSAVSTNVLSKIYVPGNVCLTRTMAPAFSAHQQTLVVRYVTNNTMPQW